MTATNHKIGMCSWKMFPIEFEAPNSQDAQAYWAKTMDSVSMKRTFQEPNLASSVSCSHMKFRRGESKEQILYFALVVCLLPLPRHGFQTYNAMKFLGLSSRVDFGLMFPLKETAGNSRYCYSRLSAHSKTSSWRWFVIVLLLTRKRLDSSWSSMLIWPTLDQFMIYAAFLTRTERMAIGF